MLEIGSTFTPITYAAGARSWGELLGDGRPDEETADQRAGLFSRLRDSLGRSRRALTQELAAATFDPGETASWERLEEALIAGDVGVPATAELVRRLEARGELLRQCPAATPQRVPEPREEPRALIGGLLVRPSVSE